MRGGHFLRVIGRLKPGITLDQAKAALATLENSYRTQFPEKIDAQSRNIIKPLPEDVTENLRPGFATLLAAVAFVLLALWRARRLGRPVLERPADLERKSGLAERRGLEIDERGRAGREE